MMHTKVDGMVFKPRRLAKQRLELFLACLGISALIVLLFLIVLIIAWALLQP